MIFNLKVEQAIGLTMLGFYEHFVERVFQDVRLSTKGNLRYCPKLHKMEK